MSMCPRTTSLASPHCRAGELVEDTGLMLVCLFPLAVPHHPCFSRTAVIFSSLFPRRGPKEAGIPALESVSGAPLPLHREPLPPELHLLPLSVLRLARDKGSPLGDPETPTKYICKHLISLGRNSTQSSS